MSYRPRKIEQTDRFTYLGCVFSEDGKFDKEICNRISKAGGVSAQLRSTLFCKREVSVKTKLSVHRAVFRPTLMYGSESWIDNGNLVDKMEVADMRVLRMISGVSRWRQWQDRISNDTIREDLIVKSVKEASVQARLRWWGHVQRMGENRLPRKLLNSKMEGKRGRGRPPRRWEDAVGNDLDNKGVSWDEAREMAGDRGKWRSFVRSRDTVER